uniref:Uncharacterized protein n=1 Tax=Caudovirales sp. ctCiv1 TaxID=2826769 RepID=A0A8S5M8R9_9CAUD|nr:MAG TPA: hypothetical protein [Caudovirales sp. ctCiv1]
MENLHQNNIYRQQNATTISLCSCIQKYLLN